MQSDLFYKIAITLFNGVGPVTIKKLVAHIGGVEAVFKEAKSNLKKLKVPEVLLNQENIKTAFEKAEKEIEFISAKKIEPLFYLDSAYPKRLKHCEDGPILLYYKGNANLNTQRIISVVGTRKASLYGKEFCEKFISDLKETGVMIVSGLAYGIDICAHKAALNEGLKTVGVVAHGLNRIYPSDHRSVAVKMIEQGGLLTDFCSSDKFHPGNFPSRNRIIAGISDATVVIETDVKGGAVITADIANSYNRDVFAVPGSVYEKYSAGCNWLIKTNRAALIQSAQDLMNTLNWKTEKSKQPIQHKLLLDLNEEETKIANLLKQTFSVGIDDISIASDMPLSKVTTLLLEMEFKGIIKALPGKHYKLV
ncbi:MAG: DNA-protecting protein DprA [Bacteroidetes bacterium]|nr:DNA-protecting protein DprA [Bacteroidota bacterium]MBV6461288.1 hypothetical protein [Flavobacteriales bacterium]WKZ75312.1 MAG: DNA-processing protein DprA [Vicingaceae bacterium]MCL4816579.1 DNA-processing protein DprA [Flavobacteriales bacterium]NOG94325.1 DNA-protecting protein DprA [Bacteroidota bacterium]